VFGKKAPGLTGPWAPLATALVSRIELSVHGTTVVVASLHGIGVG
jgi:hypothetical protein